MKNHPTSHPSTPKRIDANSNTPNSRAVIGLLSFVALLAVKATCSESAPGNLNGCEVIQSEAERGRNISSGTIFANGVTCRRSSLTEGPWVYEGTESHVQVKDHAHLNVTMDNGHLVIQGRNNQCHAVICDDLNCQINFVECP